MVKNEYKYCLADFSWVVVTTWIEQPTNYQWIPNSNVRTPDNHWYLFLGWINFGNTPGETLLPPWDMKQRLSRIVYSAALFLYIADEHLACTVLEYVTQLWSLNPCTKLCTIFFTTRSESKKLSTINYGSGYICNTSTENPTRCFSSIEHYPSRISIFIQ